jgi:hypothetical protein
MNVQIQLPLHKQIKEDMGDMQEREILPVQGECDSSDGRTTGHHIEVGRGSDSFN